MPKKKASIAIGTWPTPEKIQRYKKQQVEEILEEAERFRKKVEKKKLNVTTVTREQLEKKLAESKSPMIIAQWWSLDCRPGGTFVCGIEVHNPDPVIRASVYAYVFVGLGSIVPDEVAALATVDPRFPRLIFPERPGIYLNPGETTEIIASLIPIPAGIEPGTYLGNTFLFKFTDHDVGGYYDRSHFLIEVLPTG